MDQPTPVANKPYVYKLSYPDGTAFYIGKGTGRRINNHEWEASRSDEKSFNTHKSRVIRKIWKTGGEVLKEIVSYFETDEEAHAYEIALIFFMRPYGHLTNITDGGDGISGYKHSKETRRRLSEAHKAEHLSEETRRRLSEGSKAEHLSEETRRRLSEGHKGRKHSEETRRKISEAQRGIKKAPVSDETRRKLSEARKGKTSNRKGEKTSEETRRKISESLKGRVVPEERRRKISEAHMGHIVHEETRQKLREANLGKKASEETRQKLKGRVPANKGKPTPEERKLKISEAMKKRWEAKRASHPVQEQERNNA